MTLDQAVQSIAASITLVDADDCEPASTHDITSGGEREQGRDVPEPALFASQGRALEFWAREVIAFAKAKGAAAITMIDGPHLDRFETTMMDARRTQRTAEPRYSVSATVGIVTT